MIIFGIIIAFLIIKRLHYNKQKQGLMLEKISLLKDRKEQMDDLMNKISLEEQKYRFVLNAIPYPIFTMSQQGTIRHANSAFLNLFYLNMQEHPSISNVMRQFKSMEEFETWYHSFKDAIPSISLVDKFNIDHNFNVLVAKEVFQLVKTREEISVVMLQNADAQAVLLAFQNPHLSKSIDSITDNSMIKQILADKNLFAKFKVFCQETHDEDCVMFLEEVSKYKQKNKVSSRVELQQHIKQRYLVERAPHELNLPRQLLDKKVQELQTGRVDDFDELELLAMNSLAQNSLHRFLARQQGMN